VKYFVTVGSREFVVEVDGERVTVDGRAYQAHLTALPGTPLRHLLLGDRSLTLAVESAGRGSWRLQVHGLRHEVEVVDERTRHIRSLTGSGSGRAGAGPLRSPMPGLVVRLLVEPGQIVEAGAGLVVLEAMKMENELRAQAPGRVAAVLVTPGQAVERGQPLVELAPVST
jgi:pyruvate carboxylase subunit B